MTVLIEKQCTGCGTAPCRLMGAVIAGKEIKEKIIRKSYNMYWCPKCHNRFLVERSGNQSEQELTQKTKNEKLIIDASKIILKDSHL